MKGFFSSISRDFRDDVHQGRGYFSVRKRCACVHSIVPV